MMKSLLALLVCVCIMLPCCALADAWEGMTMVHQTTRIDAPSSGVLNSLNLRVGQAIEEGQTLGSILPNRVYAAYDGTVARVAAEPGEEASGTVVEVAQVSPYIVYCTVNRSYITAENRTLHNGQTLYLRCTSNGTHRAVGFAYNVKGDEFTMELTAGEMYIGETVYVYSSAACEQKQRVGIGTVVASTAEAYTAAGTVLTMRVTEGQAIQRGKLLFTWADGDSLAVTSPASGVVTAISVPQGTSARKDAAIAEMAAYTDILIEIQVTSSQLSRLHMDQSVTYYRCFDQGEALQTGHVSYISSLPENGLYTVRITPDVPETMLGLSVEVYN